MNKTRLFLILFAFTMLISSLCACNTANESKDTEKMTEITTDILTNAPKDTEPATEPVTEPVTEAPKILTVVCVGDSITQGVGASPAAQYSYPAQLQTILGARFKVVNCGKSKATALGSDSKFFNTNGIDYKTTSEYQTALKSNPDIVLIMLGTNDAKLVNPVSKKSSEEFYNALKEIGEAFAKLESAPDIYILASPYRYEDFTRARNTEKAVVPTQQQLATDMGWKFIDLFAATKAEYDAGKTLNTDKLHFTNDGYTFIAQTIADIIKTAE